nr:hypothetical protein Q903MT_gene5890 [Picea sitchensis]
MLDVINTMRACFMLRYPMIVELLIQETKVAYL